MIRPRRKNGFTLLELTMVMLIGIVTASLLMALFNQQLAFLKIFRAQNFLIDEAPLISMQVNRLVSKADRFRLHLSEADALAGRNAQLGDSPVMVMNFRQPDGAMRATMLSYQNGELKYYIIPTTGLLGPAQWTVTDRPTDISFFIQDGILRMTLTGPAGEEITYSGAVQSGGAIDFSGEIQQ